MPILPGSPIQCRTLPRSRTFQFTYAATVTGLKPEATAHLAAGAAHDAGTGNHHRREPKDAKLTTEKRYGNQMFYLEAKADVDGRIPLEMVVLVKRKEVKGVTKDAPESTAKLADFLQPDVKVPIAGKPLDLIKDKKLPTDQTEAARFLYDVVNAHMRYSKEGKVGAKAILCGRAKTATAIARIFTACSFRWHGPKRYRRSSRLVSRSRRSTVPAR